MPTTILTVDDLRPFAEIDSGKAAAMVADAHAIAARVAPCITSDDFEYADAARAILRAAVLRWHEAGTGALQGQTAGPFGVTMDTRQPRRGMFWPSEIQQLQDLCRATSGGSAFTIDTAPWSGSMHALACSLNFGGGYCSCGAVLTGVEPLYEDS